MLSYLWEKASFSPKIWLKSPGLGSCPRLKWNQIQKVSFYTHVVLVWKQGGLNCEMYGG